MSYFVISFRYADEVSVGDAVLVHENDELIPAKVIRVASALMQGASFFNCSNKLFILLRYLVTNVFINM